MADDIPTNRLMASIDAVYVMEGPVRFAVIPLSDGQVRISAKGHPKDLLRFQSAFNDFITKLLATDSLGLIEMAAKID